jgi:hypothetical protein
VLKKISRACGVVIGCGSLNSTIAVIIWVSPREGASDKDDK